MSNSYIVSEEELKELANNCWSDIGKGEPQYDCVGNLLKSKQPVEMVAEGEINNNYGMVSLSMHSPDYWFEHFWERVNQKEINIKIYISKVESEGKR
jgi:hypothetical protein